MLKSSLIVGLAAASLMAASSATAATSIAVNSGVDANNDKRDDVWTVNGGAAFIPTNIPTSYPGPASSWLTPALQTGNNPLPASVSPGLYNFLGVLDLSSIVKIGTFAVWQGTIFSDNSIDYFRVNGKTFPSSISGFTSSSPFSIAFNPLQGNNTFEIGLRNAPLSGGGFNPAAVRFSGTVTAVPEPGTWLLMILGLGAVGFAMRRRQAASVRLQFA